MNFNQDRLELLTQSREPKILWDLGLNIKAGDFNKDGRLEDVDKVNLLRKDLNHVIWDEESEEFKDAVVLETFPMNSYFPSRLMGQ